MVDYFPMYMDMTNLKILVLGVYIAMEKLVDVTRDITVIALEVEDETQNIIDVHALKLQQRAYEVGCRGA